MKTTMNIPRELLDKAVRLTGVRTKTGAVVLALEELVRRREVEALLAEAGTFDFPSDEEQEAVRHER